MKRMSDATFRRLTHEGGACLNCRVATTFFSTETRDVARVFAEAERARSSEEIYAKALARIIGIASTTRNNSAGRLLRILRVADAAQREADQ